MGNRALLSYHLRRRRHRNQSGRVKCPWSSIMYCDKHRNCPMENRGFISALEAWLMTGRTPRTIDFEADGQGYRLDEFDSRMVIKAELYRLFADPDGVEYFLSHQYARMHKRLCMDLSQAHYVWREIAKGFTRIQGEKFYKAEAQNDI